MEEKRSINLGNRVISYKIRKSRRARYMRLSVKRDAEVVLTIPWRMEGIAFERFILEKINWILEKVDHFKRNQSNIPVASRKDYLKYKDLAKEIAEKKLDHFNVAYGFSWKRVSIRNQKTRWGSCSRSGNLNFSYRIAYLPEKFSDYIIVHELCHLGEFNHSRNFWNLVAKTIPDYKRIRKEVRNI